jgi:hypothetical protein
MDRKFVNCSVCRYSLNSFDEDVIINECESCGRTLCEDCTIISDGLTFCQECEETNND